jgi:HlyD family secretion protein
MQRRHATAFRARAAALRGAMRRGALAWLVPLLVAGCTQAPPPGYPGYVEAEYVRVSSPLAGTLARLEVQRGQKVAADAPLFALESESERAAREEAQAQVARAQASLADLGKGRRPPEVAATRAQLAQAEAALRQSEAELARTEKLVADNFLPRQRLDDARAARDRDRARVRELGAQLQVVQLPARPDEIAAAQAQLKAATDALAQAQWRLDQKTQRAPVAGLVDDTLYRPGEWVAAGAPVVSLLPPGNVKVRFYVPEPMLARLRVGAAIRVRCDGCGDDVAAHVTFISPQAEYTPPVIYSRENRSKLVFLVEARPEAPDARLHPGLPVAVVSIADVAPGGSASAAPAAVEAYPPR